MNNVFNNLISEIEKYNSNADIELIKRAFEFSLDAHSGQERASGEPYITHPLAVAEILAGMEMDTESIAAALLHDTVEDTNFTSEDIEKIFGAQIAELVDGVTKLGQIPYSSKEEQQVENLRKMFMAMAKDIRVILIKLADRLHNMRTLRSLSNVRQREIALETMEIFAPLAHRLGIYSIKWEIEDLSQRYLDPIGYQEIVGMINQKRKEREEYLEAIKKTICEKIENISDNIQIEGRVKHFYSIYKKMYSQNKSIDEIYDLFAVRVIVGTVADCYNVLGIVHELYKPIPGRFKDYIAMPKHNMYQSLHSTVIGTKGTAFEIQIRTYEMHKTAEYGVAAHWKYKEGKSSINNFDEKMSWIRQLMEIQKEMTDAEEFMQTLKIDLFADEVFVFTPKGDVINLPAGANTIDFAFAIHTAVGCKMLGAKVNGKIVPIERELDNGDIVEIITSSSVRGPSRDWLKMIKTSQAKNKINQWFKKQSRSENIARGKELIEKELKKSGLDERKALVPQVVDAILKKYGYKMIDDIYASVGYGGVPLSRVVTRLKDEYKKLNPSKQDETIEIDTSSRKSSSEGVIVKGIENCLIRFSRCCNPVPGDDIVGYITRGRGVSVHRADCVNILNAHTSTTEVLRLIDVEWAVDRKASYIAGIMYSAGERDSLMFDISKILADFKVPVKSFNARSVNGLTFMDILLEITDKEQLENIIKRMNTVKGTVEVKRTAHST